MNTFYAIYRGSGILNEIFFNQQVAGGPGLAFEI